MSYGGDPRFQAPSQTPPPPIIGPPSPPPPAPKPFVNLSAIAAEQAGPKYFGQTQEPTARDILSRNEIPTSPPENKPYIGGFDSVPTPIPSLGLGEVNKSVNKTYQFVNNNDLNNNLIQSANNQAAIDNATSKLDTMGFIDKAKAQGVTSFDILGPSRIGVAFGSQGLKIGTTTPDKALSDLQKYQDQGIPVKLSYQPVQTENEAIPLAGLGNPLVSTSVEIPKSKLSPEYNYFNSIFSGETPNIPPKNPTFGTALLTEGITPKNTAKLSSTSFLDVLQFVPVGGEAKIVTKAAEPVIAKGIVKDITSGVLATESKPLLYGVSKVNKNFYDVGIGTEGLGTKVNEKIYPTPEGNVEPILKTTASQAKEGEANISNIFIGTGKGGITGLVPKVIDTSLVPQKALIQDFTGNTAKVLGAKAAPQYGANIFELEVTPKNIQALGAAERSGKITREANIFLTPTKDVSKNAAAYAEAAQNPGILQTERIITGKKPPTDIFPKNKFDYSKFLSSMGKDILGKPIKPSAENLKIVSIKEPKTSGFVYHYDPNTIYINAAAKGKGAFTPENIADLLSHESLHNAIQGAAGQKASEALDFLSYKSKGNIESKLIDLGVNPSSLIPEYEPTGSLFNSDIYQKNLRSYFDKNRSILTTTFEGQKETEPILTLKENKPEIVRGDVLGFYRVGSKGFTQPVEGETGSKGLNEYLSGLTSQRNKPVKNPIAPEEIIPVEDLTTIPTTSERLNKPMKSWTPAEEFGVKPNEESKPVKTVTRETSETLSRIFGTAGAEQKTVKNTYTGFSPPAKRQKEETSYNIISYPPGTKEKFNGGQRFKPSQGFDVLQEFTTKQNQIQKSKQNQGLGFLQEYQTKQEEAQRSSTLAKLTSSQTEKEKQGQGLFTIQTGETTQKGRFDLITTPVQGQKTTPIQGLLTIPTNVPPPPPTRNPPNIPFATPGSMWFGWSGDEPRKKGSKRTNFGLWNTNPNNPGEFYTPGTQEYRVSASPDIFGRNDRAIARANKKAGNQSILNYGTSIVKKGKGKATGKMKNGIFF